MSSNDSVISVPFSDFTAAHAEIRDQVEAAIRRVLDSGWYVLGQELARFEEELASWLGVKNMIGVGNGTDALVLAMLAVGAKSGDEILTSDVTAVPTIAAIQQVGAMPVPIDIDPATGLLNAERIDAAVTSRTRGVVPVHLYGRSCDMISIGKAARDHGLWIVEDCAQSIGACQSGCVTGTFGACGAFSFYPTKNLGAYGDAGAVACESCSLAERLRALRNYGQHRRDQQSERGMNSRLDEVQAAILRVKLTQLHAYTAKRGLLAARYREALPAEILPSEAAADEHVYHLFPVLVPDRDRFRECLKNAGIDSIVHYPLPVHRQPTLGPLPDDLFPEACKWTAQVVSLPLYPNLTDEAQGQVITAVNEAIS